MNEAYIRRLIETLKDYGYHRNETFMTRNTAKEAARVLEELTAEKFVPLKPGRCEHACFFNLDDGRVIATRCKKTKVGHGRQHEGRGEDQFPLEACYWLPGDKHEFRTDRTDFYAWIVKEGDFGAAEDSRESS